MQKQYYYYYYKVSTFSFVLTLLRSLEQTLKNFYYNFDRRILRFLSSIFQGPLKVAIKDQSANIPMI